MGAGKFAAGFFLIGVPIAIYLRIKNPTLEPPIRFEVSPNAMRQIVLQIKKEAGF